MALDEMGSRIDELEQSINDLKAEIGAEGSPSPIATPRIRAEDSRASLSPSVTPRIRTQEAKADEGPE